MRVLSVIDRVKRRFETDPSRVRDRADAHTWLKKKRRNYCWSDDAELRRGRRTARTFPLFPPPQKKRSPPSDSSPDTPTPRGISTVSRTSPVSESIRLISLSSPSHVPCQSSPSIHVTPVTKRFDSIVRRIFPVSGST